MAKDETNYPGWPDDVDWPPFDEWMNAVRYVPLGQGLLGSDVDGPLHPDEPPHPEYVKRWRKQKEASVSETGEYFKLSDVQVLKACR